MEEILSSIRRIIADEESEDDGPENKQARSDDAAADLPEPEEEDEDVLELTKVVREGGDVVDLKAEEGRAAEAEVEDDDEIEPSVAEAPEPAPPAAEEPVAAPSAAAAEPHSPMDEEKPAVPKQAAAGELISDAAATAATGAFAKLTQAYQRTPAEEAIAEAEGRTVEQFIEDMMRPMLKQWLDENLPRLVEEKVEREIQKIARRSELL